MAKIRTIVEHDNSVGTLDMLDRLYRSGRLKLIQTEPIKKKPLAKSVSAKKQVA